MSATPVRWVAPRIVRNHLTNRLTDMGYQQSPQDILSRFPESTRLTVKQSISKNRFFMYEEHAPNKLQDDDPMTPTITASPMELANLLSESRSSNDRRHHHYYWTSPMSNVTPTLLQEEFGWYDQLHHDDHGKTSDDHRLLDPRGPSLWMGTSGSGTQCHYDVANNVILQLYGVKRIRCFPPHVGVTHLHVFPDAHPRARKSQVDLDVLYDGTSDKEVDKLRQRYPHFVDVPPPFLDITLKPGEALEIPAFWFHHVENGDATNPSVSLNSFVLSEPMMIANQIFQKASHPIMMMRGGSASGILRKLGLQLITSLGLSDDEADAVEFIQRNLLQARYAPLMVERLDAMTTEMESITDEQQRAIETCIQTIRSNFDDLVMEGTDNNNEDVDKNGVVLLVALHLLELWAVQLVGAHSVHDAWKKALQ